MVSTDDWPLLAGVSLLQVAIAATLRMVRWSAVRRVVLPLRAIAQPLVAAPEGRGGFEAIAFNNVDPQRPAPLPTGKVRLIYRLATNDYQGELRLQLVVEHLLPP